MTAFNGHCATLEFGDDQDQADATGDAGGVGTHSRSLRSLFGSVRKGTRKPTDVDGAIPSRSPRSLRSKGREVYHTRRAQGRGRPLEAHSTLRGEGTKGTRDPLSFSVCRLPRCLPGVERGGTVPFRLRRCQG